MPRTVTVKLGGTEFHMPATLGPSEEIAQTVGDPVNLLFELATRKRLMKQSEVISILYIGAKHAGCEMTREQVGEEVVERGTVELGATATLYINSICSGGPERPVPGAKKKAGQTRAG